MVRHDQARNDAAPASIESWVAPRVGHPRALATVRRASRTGCSAAIARHAPVAMA
jgi:hypothetical protein